MKKNITFLILVILTTVLSYGQSILSPGEIAITGFNSDNPDQFTFVLLTDILSGTQIIFSDEGWLASGGFRGTGEGEITWTAATDMTCGSEITITDNSPFSATVGSVTDDANFAFSVAGDQILAFQGSVASPTFIFAINFDGAGWSDATTPNTSALPTGLTDAVNAVDVGETDNGNYNCSVVTNQVLILAGITTSSNWNTSNTILTLGGCGYSCAACPTTTTWDGTNWDNGIPDATTSAIINGDYDTSVGGVQDSFTACELTVNPGFTIMVANNSYIKIQNNITVDGTILVNPQGSVVQVNDLASVTENGIIRVIKETAVLNNWYEYTYWSSPVAGETINNGLFEAQADRRFLFNAQNFLDSTAETNNDGATEPGHDDIDDNRDDWTAVNGTDVMVSGVGYASTHSQAFFIFPTNYQYDFEGPFNNGVITVPVYRNDSQMNDNNWNFIGNPYPSAIDADAFLTANSNISSTINGAIFLWSQDTAPSDTANGNENLNFAASDYAIINAIGQTAGGDGTTPSRYIPSGQAFFVAYTDSATPDSTVNGISQGTVVFNNTMRVIDNNDLFFGANNVMSDNPNSLSNTTKNIIWLNLSSDNGVFSQIALAYTNGATNAYDGWSYDTPRNLSTGTYATLYSTIDSKSEKFAIQGKSPESLTTEEVIPLGFDTSIDEPTLFKFSIAQLEGNFMNGNDIFIKDNLLNNTHNLKESDYSFTSEVGVFKDRFEIVFTREALSVTDVKPNDNSLQIIELQNGNVQFKVSNPFEMKSIEIIDLLGRTLYKLDAEGNSKTFSLDNLSQATYIAKVELTNGQVITKKALKRR